MIPIRPLAAGEVETVLDALRAEGLPADASDGVWIGVVDEGRVVGTGRILERDGLQMLEDVWVGPGCRGRGIGSALVAAAAERAAAGGRPLWLICDGDMVGYYTRRGFEARPPGEFPPVFAALYAAMGEWPGRDHVHIAMCRPPAPRGEADSHPAPATS